MIKASIIIPAYNEEKDLPECLTSLKKQSEKRFEIILVDDGSTDNTIGIAKNFKIKILKQNHQGPGKARNLGAKNAKGEILVFIDADMTFDKNYLKNLINPLLKNKKILGTTHDYEVAKNIENKWSYLWGEIRVSKEGANQVKIFRAIKKKKFLELGGFDQKYGYADDQTFWFKYGLKPTVAKNTICYHKNPEDLKGTFKQAEWIGASWKERFLVFRIPLLNYLMVFLVAFIIPFWALIKSFEATKKISFKDKFNFFWVKFWGYYRGIKKAVFRGEVWK